MARFFFANGTDGFRVFNLELVQRAARGADGSVFLEFGKDHHFTLDGKDAELCWEAINQLWVESGRLGTPAESRTGRPQVGEPTVSNYSQTARARLRRMPSR